MISNTPSGKKRGFALLITITLVAFLVLVLVSLATFTRVETRVATNNQHLNMARQNALLAVNLALGELQKYTGPDQRVTARADALTSYPLSPAASDSSATFDAYWTTRSRHWTGVWGNSQTAIGYDLRPDQINGRGVTPELLNWLVSGNEGSAFSPSGNKGGVTSITGPQFLPDAIVANLSTATGLSTDLTIPNKNGESKPAVLLVGPGTTGPQTSGESYYVAAPLRELTAPASTIPGASGTSATEVKVGGYAWWVGDEGVKARVNIQNGYERSGLPSDRINSFLVSQRSAAEYMESDATGSTIGAAYDSTSPLITRILQPRQLTFSGPDAGAQAQLASASKHLFHDITTLSNGVLSDTYAGGLKKDLTADIADTSPAAGMPSDADPLFTPLSSSEANLPTWGQLRSWARTHPDSSGLVPPNPPSDTQAGFGPVMLYASLGLDIYIDAGNVVRVALYPVAVLSNPYPVDIDATDYDLGFKLPANASFALMLAAPSAPGSPTPGTFSQVATLHLGTPAIIAGTSTSTASNFIRFEIKGRTIPAGESHVYRLDSNFNGDTYFAGVPLVRAPDALVIGLSNHVQLPGTVTLDASTTPQHFFRVDRKNLASIEVALTEPGSLNSANNQYQACSVMIPSGINSLINTAASNQQISGNWDLPTTGARAAIRFGSPLEQRGDYSAMGRFGMAVQPMSWLRFGNIRAPFIEATTLESEAPGLTTTNRAGAIPFGCGLANDTVANRNVALFYSNHRYAVNLSGNADASNVNNTHYATLFDILQSPERLLSLGQFQNAPLSRYSFYPSYPFANAMGDPRVDRLETYRNNIVPRPGSTSTRDPYYDLSWHLNRSLWDRFFVSGTPASLTQGEVDQDKPLPNSRLKIYRGDEQSVSLDKIRYTGGTNQAYYEAAAHLLVSGGFNINSTSEQAWRAVLGGPLGVTADTNFAATGAGGDDVELIVPFPRFSNKLVRAGGGAYPAINKTMAADSTSEANFRSTLYHGNRGLYLNDSRSGTTNANAAAVAAELARTIVREVRTRGPFLSLSDFVNRPILASKQAAGIKGALQSAIDRMEPAAAQANPYGAWNSIVNPAMTTGGLLYSSWDSEHFIGGPTTEVGSGRDSFRFNYSFSPKYLTQADVLTSLGPQLTARSDTFLIRTYGETVNPVTQEVEARAWCEAVVQRLPEYADESINQPQDAPSGINITLGRRLKVVSFRWLNPSEI